MLYHQKELHNLYISTLISQNNIKRNEKKEKYLENLIYDHTDESLDILHYGSLLYSPLCNCLVTPGYTSGRGRLCVHQVGGQNNFQS